MLLHSINGAGRRVWWTWTRPDNEFSLSSNLLLLLLERRESEGATRGKRLIEFPDRRPCF